MTTTNLYATSHITGSITNPSVALGAPDSVFTEDVDNTSWDSRFALDDIPAGETLDGTQTITVRVRKETGTGTPTLTAEVWENGSFVATLFTSTSITSLIGQDVSGTFSAASIINHNDVEIRLIGTQSGGGPSARSTPQIDAITWTAVHVTGGSNFTKTINDPLGETDSAPAVLTSVRTISDPVGLTDSGFATMVTTAETLGFTDSISVDHTPGGSDHTKTINDPVGLSDVGSFEIERPYDRLGLTDSVSYEQSGSTEHTQTVNDPLGLTDTRSVILSRTLTDNLGITDLAAQTATLVRSQNDSLSLTDTITATAVSVPAFGDALNLTDVMAPTRGIHRKVTRVMVGT